MPTDFESRRTHLNTILLRARRLLVCNQAAGYTVMWAGIPVGSMVALRAPKSGYFRLAEDGWVFVDQDRLHTLAVATMTTVIYDPYDARACHPTLLVL